MPLYRYRMHKDNKTNNQDMMEEFKRRLIDLQVRPETLPPHVVAELRMELEELRQPPVEGGPVSFCCRTMLWGGAADPHQPFLFPFSRQFTRRTGSFDQLLMEAAGLASGRCGSHGAAGRGKAGGLLRSVWRRAKGWLSGRGPWFAKPPRPAPPAPVIAPPEAPLPPIPDPADPARGYTLEELTALISRYPRHAQLYNLRAELFEQREAYERAIEDYTAWLALRPGQPEIYSRRAMACCAAGSQARKRLPRPASDSISSRPWWRISTCFTIASPNPVPPVSRERLRSTR